MRAKISGISLKLQKAEPWIISHSVLWIVTIYKSQVVTMYNVPGKWYIPEPFNSWWELRDVCDMGGHRGRTSSLLVGDVDMIAPTLAGWLTTPTLYTRCTTTRRQGHLYLEVGNYIQGQVESVYCVQIPDSYPKYTYLLIYECGDYVVRYKPCGDLKLQASNYQ